MGVGGWWVVGGGWWVVEGEAKLVAEDIWVLVGGGWWVVGGGWWKVKQSW